MVFVASRLDSPKRQRAGDLHINFAAAQTQRKILI